MKTISIIGYGLFIYIAYSVYVKGSENYAAAFTSEDTETLGKSTTEGWKWNPFYQGTRGR